MVENARANAGKSQSFPELEDKPVIGEGRRWRNNPNACQQKTNKSLIELKEWSEDNFEQGTRN